MAAEQSAGAGAVYLTHRHVFGLKADVRNNVHFHDENQVIYCAGHNTVQYFMEHKSQRFFAGNEGTVGITCLAVSPNKRYLGIAEKSPDTAMVTIYDLVTTKKKKTLQHPDIDPQEFTSIAFSAENKFLLTQGGLSPSGKNDWTLCYWNWEKGKVMASQNVSNAKDGRGNAINEVSFNPTDSDMVCVVGDSILKFLRQADGAFKQAQTQFFRVRDAQNYLCHAWLSDDRLVVGCENGDLLLFDNTGEFKVTLPCSIAEPRSVSCILGFSKGFVIGGASSMIRVFEKSDDPKEMFRKQREMRVDSQPVTVKSMAMSPTEEVLACTTSSAQLYQLSLLGSDLLKSGDDLAQVEPMLTGFHVGPILGMDVCIRKPLVVTCGMDKTVRVWNYVDKTCEQCRLFNEEAYSVAFHPSGFHLIVGFSDKLKLMNLLMEDMRPFKDIPIKACREVRFSHGGNMFAAVNSNTIQVFKTYSCEVVCNLRGHNNKVRSLSWTADDTTLVSAGADGAVYEYNILRDGHRESDWVHKGTSFSCVIVYTDPSTGQNTTYVVGSDKMLREVTLSALQNFLIAGKTIGQICLSNSAKTMFSSIAEQDTPGGIRCYKFPLDGEYAEYQAHSAPATRLRVTVDDQYLFSTGEDACLFIFDVRKKDRVLAKRDKDTTLPFADEIMVTRTFLDEKQAKLTDLERQVEELRNQIDFQLRHRDSYHKEKMSELEDKYTQEIEQERTKFELLREEKNDMEMEYEENFKNVDELHAKQIQDLEANFQHKMMIEVAKYQKLAAEREREHEEWQKQHKGLLEAHQRKVAELQKKFEDQEADDRAHKTRIIEEKELNSKVHGETLNQLEKDADTEIEELKRRYKENLSAEHDDKVRLKGQAGIHRKHHEDLKRQMQKKDEELRMQQDEARKKQEWVDKLIRERDQNLKEIRERDKTIGDKEQRIYDLKKQNQELEKFKFVLDYKIKELKAQIDPKNDSISQMKKKIQEMDENLEDFHKKNKQLKLDIDQLTGKQKSYQEEILKFRKKLTDGQTVIKRFKNDLHECVQYIQEPKLLHDKITTLHQKYVPNGVKRQELDQDIQKEYQRQKEYLEKSVESLKRKLQKDSEVHRQDNMRVMQENVSLIREINDLRKEINFLKHERQQQRLHVTRKKDGDDEKKEAQLVQAVSSMQNEMEANKTAIEQLRKALGLDAGI